MVDYTGTDNLEVLADAVNYNQFLLSLVRQYAQKKQSILDFGAGIETFAHTLTKEGCQIQCLEPDVKQARTIARLPLPVSTNVMQMEDASIDFIYSFNVLERIESDVEALRECHRVLKPGGKVLIYVPAFQILFSSMDRKVGYLRWYTRLELMEKLSDTCSVVSKSLYADSLGFFASLLFLAIGNYNGNVDRKALIAYDRFVFPFCGYLDKFLGKLVGKNILAVAKKE